MNNLQQRIRDEVLRIDGKVNTAVIRRNWFKESVLCNDIHKTTSFLNRDEYDVHIKERIYCILHNIDALPLCHVCHNPAVFLPSHGAGYSVTCNNSSCCSISSTPKRIDTCISKYGSKVSPKTIRLSRERVDNFVRKSRETLKKRYGVDNPGEMVDHKDKVKRTLQTRYGVDTIHQIPSRVLAVNVQRLNKFVNMSNRVTVTSVTKRVSDNRRLFDVEFTCNSCNDTETLKGETFEWRVKQFGSPCSSCCGVLMGSVAQQEILHFITSIYSGKVIMNDKRTITPLELDILLPTERLAIEYNGLFWHSVGAIPTRIDKKYHITKTEMCQRQEIRLIHVFENEWINKQSIVKSRIRHALGLSTRIHARKCSIRLMQKLTTKEFFERTHIQGHCGFNVAYGLYHNDELVSVMSFTKPRFTRKVEWELLRYSSELDTSVVGGASKLFAHFIKKHNPVNVISYADKRWALTNAMYKHLKFIHQHDSIPNYFYFKSQEGMKLFSRVTFQKHKLKDKLEIFDPSISEPKNMINNGYRQIWDCGNQVWLWESGTKGL